MKVSKVMNFKVGDTLKVSALTFQLEEIGVPRDYVNKTVEVANFMFNPVDSEEVCVTKCGWLIPTKYLDRDEQA